MFIYIYKKKLINIPQYSIIFFFCSADFPSSLSFFFFGLGLHLLGQFLPPVLQFSSHLQINFKDVFFFFFLATKLYIRKSKISSKDAAHARKKKKAVAAGG